MSQSNYSLASRVRLNNGVEMPRIHLGVYMTSGKETERAVTYALEAGYVAFDSAEWYANEKEVGTSITRFLNSPNNTGLKREDLWFTTKLKSNVGYDATRKSIKRSIAKCGLGYLDLYLLHSPYGGRDKRLECWKAVEDAIAEGEVRVGGVSNFGVRHVSLSYALLLAEKRYLEQTADNLMIAARASRFETKDRAGHQPDRSPPFQYTNRYNDILSEERYRRRSLCTARESHEV
jgi:diketogulonate reductase-like aldo/keto reductase